MHTRIFDQRTKLRMTQPELSQKTGISQSQISKYEKGEVSKPSYQKLIRIAEVLGCCIEDITDREQKKTQTAFQAFNSTGPAVFIPLYAERQKMNTEFQHGSGFVVRLGGASQQQIRKPSFLDYSETAYAVTTYSENMLPRYKLGDVCFVDPKLSAQQGDDICVLFNVDAKLVGLIRECVEVSESTIRVLDLQTNKTITFKTNELYGVHVIVGTQKYRG
jgi:transcriptional regulator with XRE-family HTH domain